MSSDSEKLHLVLNQLSAVSVSLHLIEAHMKDTNLLLRGDGGKVTGVIIDIDRLKQHKVNTDRTFWGLIIPTAVYVFARFIWDFLTNHKSGGAP